MSQRAVLFRHLPIGALCRYATVDQYGTTPSPWLAECIFRKVRESDLLMSHHDGEWVYDPKKGPTTGGCYLDISRCTFVELSENEPTPDTLVSFVENDKVKLLPYGLI